MCRHSHKTFKLLHTTCRTGAPTDSCCKTAKVHQHKVPVTSLQLAAPAINYCLLMLMCLHLLQLRSAQDCKVVTDLEVCHRACAAAELAVNPAGCQVLVNFQETCTQRLLHTHAAGQVIHQNDWQMLLYEPGYQMPCKQKGRHQPHQNE